ncbi:hypothetical protein [Enterobacter asburiae]|uniref:hypothetical protein n=1 Tax=Enterobacter asburiae TaxID=61645 RepID=UPI003B25B139
MKLFEMEGFLRGKCLPGDMKVNETNAEYLVRKFTELEQKLAESQREFRAADATIENMQMQVEKLAAENAGLKSAIDATIGWQQSTDPENVESVRMLVDIKTPATDAFMAEVRAQGVEMFAAWNDKHIKKGVEHKESLTAVSHAARGLAEQIRKGVQS